jgi:hypothetical protein
MVLLRRLPIYGCDADGRDKLRFGRVLALALPEWLGASWCNVNPFDRALFSGDDVTVCGPFRDSEISVLLFYGTPFREHLDRRLVPEPTLIVPT